MSNRFIAIILTIMVLGVGLSQVDITVNPETKEKTEVTPNSNPYGGNNEVGIIEVGDQGHYVVGIYDSDGIMRCSYPISSDARNGNNYKTLGCNEEQEGKIFTEKGFTE